MYIVRVTTQTLSLEELAGELISASGRLLRLVGAETDATMSVAAARALARLQETGPCRVTELARSERCAQPSMTALVDRLERAGCVRRGSDAGDARAVLVAITDEGRRQLAETRAAMAAVLAPSLRRLDADDLAQLTGSARIIRSMMEDFDN